MASEAASYREARSRLPEQLWAAAAKLARRDGIAATARVLGVDRPSLQKWTDRLERLDDFGHQDGRELFSIGVFTPEVAEHIAAAPHYFQLSVFHCNISPSGSSIGFTRSHFDPARLPRHLDPSRPLVYSYKNVVIADNACQTSLGQGCQRSWHCSSVPLFAAEPLPTSTHAPRQFRSGNSASGR